MRSRLRQGVVIVVTGGNKRLLITTPYHSYYQVVRLCVVIVVIKKRELFIVVTTQQGYGVFCLIGTMTPQQLFCYCLFLSSSIKSFTIYVSLIRCKPSSLSCNIRQTSESQNICNALSVDICNVSANCFMIRAILFHNKKSNIIISFHMI